MTSNGIRLDRASEAQPRSEPVVGRAWISDYGLLKISRATSPCAKGLWVAHPDSPGDSSRHCNDRVHSRPPQAVHKHPALHPWQVFHPHHGLVQTPIAQRLGTTHARQQATGPAIDQHRHIATQAFVNYPCVQTSASTPPSPVERSVANPLL